MSLYNVNRATLLGNLVKEPEVRTTPNGTTVCTLNMATNNSKKSGDSWEDVPTFHRLVAFGKTAEFCGKNLSKSSKVYVEGRIENRSYEQNGEKKYISEIVIDKIISMAQSNNNSFSNEPSYDSQDNEERVDPDEVPNFL
jgi:single-strand DNA-binding protein